MSKNNKILESDIKSQLLNYLRDKKSIDKYSLIMNELTVGKHTRRVDLAILSNGKIIAYEIKSEADSLYRIDGQVNTYLKYFDKVIVVTDSKFTNKLKDILPENVGIWEIEKSAFKIIKRGRLNTKIDNKYLLDQIDSSEMKKLATKLKIKRTKSRDALEKALLNAPTSKLRSTLEDTLKRKFQTNNNTFFHNTRYRKINNDDLKLLSRFHTLRESSKRKQEKNKNFWKNIASYTKELSKLTDTQRG